MKNPHNISKMTEEQKKEYVETYIDFWAWVATDAVFSLTPYILIFVVLGWIFS